MYCCELQIGLLEGTSDVSPKHIASIFIAVVNLSLLKM
jgi:hypothetical protein